MTSRNTVSFSSQEQEKQFDLLAMDATEYSIIIVDLDGHLISWNTGAERMFGYQSQEILGKHWSVLYARQDFLYSQSERESQQAITTGHAERDCWHLRKDGTEFWCHATMTPLLDKNQQTVSLARVIHDLTEVQAAAEQLKRAGILAESNRNMEEFMAILSHELRGPLSPIRNSLDILRQLKISNPVIRQAGDTIDRQVNLMVRLVDDLLDVCRITQGKLRLSTEQVELRDIVKNAAEAARPFMNARQHEFSVSLPSEPAWVQADPARLEQVVTNLLNNAGKYTDNGGLIRLSVNRNGAEAVIQVRDNGIGIAPELLPEIFDLFAQVKSSMCRSYGGLGIGLALARNLIEMQDGKLLASSAGLGRGSEFTVRLPLLLQPVLPARTAPKKPHDKGPSMRVLVAEDNVDAAECLRVLIQMHGHNVQVARTGPAALELALAFRPQVLLLDIGLPEMDGRQVAMRLREMPEFRDVMICALTGYSPTEQDQQDPRQTGFDHYYVKPVDLSTLLPLLKTAAVSTS